MILVLIGLVGQHVAGQDEGAAELYGRGVHAYFAGDYELAVSLLSESLEKNNLDPRSYYFRGLALASIAGIDSGLADFTKGADVEINRADRPVYDINGALQRVQGSLRLELEKVRAATRKAAVGRKKKRDLVRYEELKRREDIVLFDPNRPVPLVKLDLPKPDLGGQLDPFASGTAFSGGKQVENVVPAEVEPAMPGETDQPRDPFAAAGADAGETPAEAADPFASPGKSDDPFGATKPAVKTPPAPKPLTDANPFGENLPKLDLPVDEEPAVSAANIGGGLINLLGKTLSGAATDRDPFGAPTKAEPAQDGAAEKQEDAQPPAEAPAADPFADGAEKKADAKKPADAPAGDPFGSDDAKEEEDAKKPADKGADPFK
jgi:hypothetical protein